MTPYAPLRRAALMGALALSGVVLAFAAIAVTEAPMSASTPVRVRRSGWRTSPAEAPLCL